MMKKIKGRTKVQSALLSLTLLAQFAVMPIGVHAQTELVSGESVKIDFEEYNVDATPEQGSKDGGWVFSTGGSNKEASDLFKVKTITGRLGSESRALTYQSQPDSEASVTYSGYSSARYYLDEPIYADYVEASYDLYVKYDYTIRGSGEIISAGFVGKKDEITPAYTLSNEKPAMNDILECGVWNGSPYCRWAMRYYDASKQNPLGQSFSGNDSLVDKLNTVGYWVKVKKLFDMKNDSYTLYVNGVNKGTFACGGAYYDTTTWTPVYDSDVNGLASFSIDVPKDAANASNLEWYLDNLSIKKYNPDAVSYDFEEEKIGALPNGWSFATNTTNTNANDFFKVQETQDIDGKNTKALYFTSQPTEGTTYKYSDYPRATYTFNTVKSRYIKVSYDVKIDKVEEKYNDQSPMTIGAITVGSDDSVQSIYGKPVIKDFVFCWDNIARWRVGNLGKDWGTVWDSNGTSSWKRFVKIIDTQEDTYTAYADGEVLYQDLSIGNSTAGTPFDAVGVNQIKALMLKSDTYKDDVSWWIDNVNVEPVDYKYLPATYGYNFEKDEVGTLPTKGWAYRTSNAATADTFYSVAETTGKDGETTKALHYTSQPGNGGYTFTSGNYQWANFTLSSPITSRFVKASYDIKVVSAPPESGTSGDGGTMVGVSGVDASGNEAGTNWGVPVNREYIYYVNNTPYWKISGDGLGGLSYQPFGTDNTPKWITVERVFDTVNQTFTLYVDGVKMAEKAPLVKGTNHDYSVTPAQHTPQGDMAGIKSLKVWGPANTLNNGENYEYYLDNISIEELNIDIGDAALTGELAAGKTVKVTIPTKNESNLPGIAILAFKSGDRFVSAATANIESGTRTTTITATIPEGAGDTITAEVYFWDSLDYINPICDKKTPVSK